MKKVSKKIQREIAIGRPTRRVVATVLAKKAKKK